LGNLPTQINPEWDRKKSAFYLSKGKRRTFPKTQRLLQSASSDEHYARIMIWRKIIPNGWKLFSGTSGNLRDVPLGHA
jgi:hypothetical protein